METEQRSLDELAVSRTEPFTRRSFLGIGSAFIAAIAVLSTPKSALADPQNSPCCCLAKANRCSTNPCGGWNCPSGYNATCWNCSAGGHWYVCGECSQGSDCYTGEYYCSIWFGQSSPGCPLNDRCH